MNAYEKPSGSVRLFSLHLLLNELLNCYARVKKDHRKFFINEVPAHFIIRGDQVAPLVGDLYAIISSHPGYVPVHISATSSGQYVKLFAKEPGFPGFCFPGAMAA
jgi:hypothetical protein